MEMVGFPDGPVVKNLPCKAGDAGTIPGQERSYMPFLSAALDVAFQGSTILHIFISSIGVLR